MESIVVDKMLACNICDGNVFNECDGFYYCKECGTKSDHVHAVEIEQDEVYHEQDKYRKTTKILKEETETPTLTSWECYNYVLRGLVDELLNFGVKDDFKLMVLQVWASFLRRKEVAFFNKTHAALPKLGVRYLQSDLRTLYNHQKKKKTRTKQSSKSSNKSGETSDSVSKRQWRKSKKNLDTAIYSSDSKQSSSTGGTSARAVLKLEFSSRARKYYKTQMSAKHLEKHAGDSDGSMICHSMPRTTDLNQIEYARTMVNIKQLYTILAIALNLVQEDIQFGDLLRFIAEDNIVSIKNVQKFFPENVSTKTKQLLKEIKFYSSRDKFTHRTLYQQVGILARFLKITEFKFPDMKKLTRRYVTELCLPTEVADYVERLMALVPPKMHTRLAGNYPLYEARVMAYIIYVLKLLFGLDGQKEQSISTCAVNINNILKNGNSLNKTPAQLFVWSEWIEYVEMRKVIISQYNAEFSKQFKQQQSLTQKIAEMAKQSECLKEESTESMESTRNDVKNLQNIMEALLQHHATDNTIKAPIFPATLTPATDYFKIIKMEMAPPIPTFMHIDHSKRTLQPYLCAGAYRNLRAYLQTEGYKLKLKLMSCDEQRQILGFFSGKENYLQAKVTVKKADFNINEKDWLQSLPNDKMLHELYFQKETKLYTDRHMRRLRKKKFQTKKRLHVGKNTSIAVQHLDQKANRFNEYNMDPIEGVDLTQPRRQLNIENIFEGLSDIEEESDTEASNIVQLNKELSTLDFITSNFDCWMLLGNVNSLIEMQKYELLSLLPLSLRWLIDTCAQTIYVPSSVLYEQLIIVELMFNYGIENLDELKDCIHLRYNIAEKELNMLMNIYREMY